MPSTRISEDMNEMNFEFIHDYLSNSYWSQGISKSRMKAAMENSINFGVFENEKQVAYARVISDRATYAYLCDVFVDEKYRGKGYSKMLMTYILERPYLQNLRKFALATRDAHSLYAQFGWTQLQEPDRQMEINRPGLYSRLQE